MHTLDLGWRYLKKINENQKTVTSDAIPVSEYIATELFKKKVTHIFGYPGANITYLIDAITAHIGLKYIQAYHELGAAFEANGYAQAANSLGVAIASSGPGALSLVNGIANAYCDSIPVLFICGDLSRRYIKTELPMRQDGFQSTDIISVVKPITKYAAQVKSPEDVRFCLEKAIYEALNGRCGPTLLSIPHWIQRTLISPSMLSGYEITKLENTGSVVSYDHIIKTIEKSKKPLLLIGGGGANESSKIAIQNFLSRHSIPVVASLCGLSVVSHDHDCYVGFIGDYGHRHANSALAASDCVIVLGSRMDERQVGFLNNYRENKTIIHVDIDDSELSQPSNFYLPILQSICAFLKDIQNVSFETSSISKWKNALNEIRNKYPVAVDSPSLSPYNFISKLFSQLQPETQTYVDVGLHQMCTAQYGLVTDSKKIYFSGGLGSMGYAIPASIGGFYAKPMRETICIVGDGGFMMSLPELQTISRENLDIKIFVFNNNCLGMIRTHQIAVLEGRTTGSVDGYTVGDIRKISDAFNINYHIISTLKDTDSLPVILHTKGPAIIEVLFDEDMKPFPASVNYPLQEYVQLINGMTPE